MIGLVLRASQELQKRLQEEAAKSALPGQQRETPGSSPPARRAGELAQGYPVTDSPPHGDQFDPGHVDVHQWLQPPKAPEDFAVLHPLPPQPQNEPLGSSLTEHIDHHEFRVQRLNNAGAASSHLPGNPSGNPAAYGVADHTAPTGVGAVFRESPPGRGGLPYLPAPGGGT